MKRTLYFVLSFTFTAFILLYFAFFFQGSQENKFLSDLEEKINLNTANLRISEIVDGNWDSVCLLDKDTKKNYNVDVNRINFYYAMVFIKNDMVIKTLDFKPRYVTLDGFIMPQILFDNKHYRFVSNYGQKCLTADQAHLEAKIITTGCCGESNEIIFSSNKEL